MRKYSQNLQFCIKSVVKKSCQKYTYGILDEWMDRGMDSSMDGCMDEWMDGWKVELMTIAIGIAMAMCLHCSYYFFY